MFKKLHIRLTLFCTAVTSLILAAMTFICLGLSESDTSRHNFLVFQTHINAMVSYLNSQSILTHKWILEMEHTYDLKLRITDNGNELFYDQLKQDETSSALIALAEEEAKKQFDLDITTYDKSSGMTNQAVFHLPSSKEAYAAVVTIPREYGFLSVTAVHTLEQEQAQLIRQRMLFAIAAGFAILLFGLFSYIFTKRLLIPIEENRRKQSQFIASASHELRTPLTVILSSLSAMEDAPPDKRERFASHIREEGKHMNRLINDMLSLANADNGSWSMSLCPTEPDTLLLNIYEKYQPLAAAKQIRMNIQLPETPVPVQNWDKDRISQVLGILADNAISYTQEGGTIHFLLKESKGCLEFRISDNGPGIPNDKKEAVFGRFYRVDEAHREKEHFGLGLCIAAEIIRMHKGTIRVVDTPGGGATFVVRLSA